MIPGLSYFLALLALGFCVLCNHITQLSLNYRGIGPQKLQESNLTQFFNYLRLALPVFIIVLSENLSFVLQLIVQYMILVTNIVEQFQCMPFARL